MSIEELEALLEVTRQRIADQGRIVDARLVDKEQMLVKALGHSRRHNESSSCIAVSWPATTFIMEHDHEQS